MASIAVENKGDMAFEVKIGNRTMMMDVPPSMGGKDRAPTPTDVFAASLAACINALVSAYCRDMKMACDGLKVTLDYEKLEKPSRLGKFKARIIMPAGAKGWEARKDGILRAADRCPVHETIRMHEGLECTVE